MKAMLLCIALASVLCSGCVKYVYVPVVSCPYGEIPAREPLKTDSLSEQTDVGGVMKAMTWDLVYLKGYTDRLILYLEGYKMTKPQTK